MGYSKISVQTNTRLNTYFSHSGFYPACVYYAEHGKVNWESRALTIRTFSEKFRNTSSQYDCIIGFLNLLLFVLNQHRNPRM